MLPTTDAEVTVDQAQEGIAGLAIAVQRLALARTLEEVQEIVRGSARALTGADGATFVLKDGGDCHYADEDAIAPLWKGRRFPLGESVSGWTMLHREPAVIVDIRTDPRVPQDVYEDTFVTSMLVVPIRTLDPIGAIGNYWANPHEATPIEISLLAALADSTAVAMENIRIREEMEQLAGRSAEVTAVNRQLEEEIEEHWRFAAEVYRQSVTDELTGLLNRRGFFKQAEHELAALRRDGRQGLCLFLDLDGLKELNDTEGHEAGDRLIIAAADMLRRVFRSHDVLARIGGDEFAVFVPGFSDVEKLVQRMRDYQGGVRMSIGAAVFDPALPRGLYELLGEADAEMYDDKRARRTG